MSKEQTFRIEDNGRFVNFVRSSLSKCSNRSNPHLFPPPRRGGDQRGGLISKRTELSAEFQQQIVHGYKEEAAVNGRR
jgi:hypothetical protein